MYFTPVHIEPLPYKINYTDRLFLMGSCFTSHLAEKLKYYLFHTDDNPFGILYNPASIELALNIIVNKKEIQASDFFQEQDIYKSFYFHSHWADTNLLRLLENINTTIVRVFNYINKTQWFFITFGTAYVYELKQNKQIVANCHKQHPQKFNHRMLSISEASTYIEKIAAHIYRLNPQAHIVFTISPVRYLKYGAHQNQISKATLHIALKEFLQKHPNAFYFPSYEIFMDELRDYRYYANDMIHPSDIGIEHVWKRFCETYFDAETRKLMNQVSEIQAAINHRPMFPDSKEYEQFKQKIKQKISQLKTQLPQIEKLDYQI
ncbi:MAG: GSCFA domain-containing protein [Bacteroidales bacterium]|nr:GSCFA domain-containing protein [Bacteroidales bacterium]